MFKGLKNWAAQADELKEVENQLRGIAPEYKEASRRELHFEALRWLRIVKQYDIKEEHQLHSLLRAGLREQERERRKPSSLNEAVENLQKAAQNLGSEMAKSINKFLIKYDYITPDGKLTDKGKRVMREGKK